MLVGADGSTGTIGGGHLEHLACQRARVLLDDATPASQRLSLALGAALGQCCGGRVELLFEVIAHDAIWLQRVRSSQPDQDVWLCRQLNEDAVMQTRLIDRSDTDRALSPQLLTRIRNCIEPALISVADQQWFVDPCRVRPPEVWIFGAGHVGRAVVRQLVLLRYRIVWVDQREDQLYFDSAPTTAPIEKRLVSDPLDEIADIPSHARVLVMTHSHDLDFQLCQQLLKREGYGFIGLIGSATKSARFRKRLNQRGLDSSVIHCPIAPGLLQSRRPESIALAIAIQLTQLDESASEVSKEHLSTSLHAQFRKGSE